MTAVPGAEPVILYGYDSNGNLVPLRLASDGTLAAASGGLTLGSTPSTQAMGDVASAGASVKAAPELHKHGMPGFGNPVAIAYAIAQGVAATLPRSDHVHQVGLTTASGVPSGNATPGANTWTDFMSVQVAAGTWLLVAIVQCSGGTSPTFVGKIYDSTTPSPNSPVVLISQTEPTGGAADLTMIAIVTPAQTTTYMCAVASTVVSSTFSKAGSFVSATGPASIILAVRLG